MLWRFRLPRSSGQSIDRGHPSDTGGELAGRRHHCGLSAVVSEFSSFVWIKHQLAAHRSGLRAEGDDPARIGLSLYSWSVSSSSPCAKAIEFLVMSIDELRPAQTRLQGLALRWLINAAGLFMIASMM
jgi:hypothetical protein